MSIYYINARNKNDDDYGWVYVNAPGLKNESLAIELIEYNVYEMHGNLNHKETFFKKDVIEMDMESFREWEDAFCNGDGDKMHEITNDIIDAQKVLRTLK